MTLSHQFAYNLPPAASAAAAAASTASGRVAAVCAPHGRSAIAEPRGGALPRSGATTEVRSSVAACDDDGGGASVGGSSGDCGAESEAVR